MHAFFGGEGAAVQPGLVVVAVQKLREPQLTPEVLGRVHLVDVGSARTGLGDHVDAERVLGEIDLAQRALDVADDLVLPDEHVE